MSATPSPTVLPNQPITAEPAALPVIPIELPARIAKPGWNLATRLLFRFGFCAWMLLGFSIVIVLPARVAGTLYSVLHSSTTGGNGPWWLTAVSWPYQAWQWLWSGPYNGFAPRGPETAKGWQGLDTAIASFLKLEGDPTPQIRSGSGDQLHNWIEVCTCLVAALAASSVWSALDRKRRAYPRLHEFLRIWLRLALASTMLGYGFAKVYPSQFSLPSVGQLLRPYGESSPMNLLWTFMGASPAYTIFSGAMEALGGVLLLFRPTALLGSLVAVAVMTNVLALNLCYDVPVKLYAAMYLMMGVTLALPDVPRLLRLTVLNRPVECAPSRPRFRRAWLNWSWHIAAIAGAVWLVWTDAYGGWQSYSQFVGGTAQKGLTGTYLVTSFLRDGVEAPALVTDNTRWKRVGLTAFSSGGIRALSDLNQRFNVAHDQDNHTLTFTAMPGKSISPAGETDDRVVQSRRPFTLTYEEPAPGTLVLEGRVDGAELKVTMTRLDASSFLLLNRGFHWVSPFPFNR